MWFIHRPLANVTAAMMFEHLLLRNRPTLGNDPHFILNLYNLFTIQVNDGRVFDLFGYAFDTDIIKSKFVKHSYAISF